MATHFHQAWLLRDPTSELTKELGDLGRLEIEKLFERLTERSVEPGDRLWYRTCPSLILRGEAQLLDLSDPRFGFRLLIREKNGKLVALINLRRIGRVLDQFKGVKMSKIAMCQLLGGSADPQERMQLKAARGVPIHRRLRGPIDHRSISSIADCLIPVPARFASGHSWCIACVPDFVTRHYGEDFAEKTVPYLRPLQFISGGLCAQACCWMADHYGYSLGLNHPIHALPDITWYARAEGARVMHLTGLSILEMIRYYNTERQKGTQSQMRLSHQFFDGEGVAQGVRIPTDQHCKPVERAIKAYVRSGLPILLRVDADRMQGRGNESLPLFDNVYNKSGLMLDRPHPIQRKAVHDLMHMIMICGYNRETSDVLFNDPGHGPYLLAGLRRLFEAGCYLRPGDGQPFAFGDRLQPPSFLSLTPAPVCLPLLSAYDDLDEKKSYGLFRIAREVGWPTSDVFPPGTLEQTEKGTGRFLLTRITDIARKASELCINRPSVEELLRGLPERLAEWPENHWIWIEERGRSLFIWDAQLSPKQWNRPRAAIKFLILFGAVCVDGQIRWALGGAVQPAKLPSASPRCDPLCSDVPKLDAIPTPALITSFKRDGLVGASKTWSHYGIAVDMYCYQREEANALLPGCSLIRESPLKWFLRDAIGFNLKRLRQYLPRRPQWDWNAKPRLHFRKRPRLPFLHPDACVCDWISKKSDNKSYIQAAARALAEHLPARNFPCVAITTYLPEFASHHKNVRKRGIRGLCFVLELIRSLNSEHGCRIETVEIVCGTVVSQIHWLTVSSQDVEARGKNESIFLVESDRKAAREEFYNSLKVISSHIPPSVLVALELEPGALGLVADYDDLVQLHNMLSKPECEFGHKIGFNCDIAHFILAGITPAVLQNDPDGPLSRIVGFHASDIGNGHFHDLVPGEVHTKDYFRSWCEVFRRAKAAPINTGRATLFISLELERALGEETVKLGVSRLKDFFS